MKGIATSSSPKTTRSARSAAIPPSERDAAARLIRLMGTLEGSGVFQLIDASGQRTDLPKGLADVVLRAAVLLAAGRSVAILPDDALLTTREAADLLNVSRQYLVRLIDAGRLPAVKVGSHRRLRLADVTTFREERDADRHIALDRLTLLSQEAGGYEPAPSTADIETIGKIGDAPCVGKTH